MIFFIMGKFTFEHIKQNNVSQKGRFTIQYKYIYAYINNQNPTQNTVWYNTISK